VDFSSHKSSSEWLAEKLCADEEEKQAKSFGVLFPKMYCSEQIVIPEKISNLLKTYAKGKNSFSPLMAGTKQSRELAQWKCIKIPENAIPI
jgi:hypothetical protein